MINNILTKREFRNKLVERVKKVKIEKYQTDTQKQCDHDFETFKETIRNDNAKFDKSAYFIVKGCIKCHHKIRTDYKII